MWVPPQRKQVMVLGGGILQICVLPLLYFMMDSETCYNSNDSSEIQSVSSAVQWTVASPHDYLWNHQYRGRDHQNQSVLTTERWEGTFWSRQRRYWGVSWGDWVVGTLSVRPYVALGRYFCCELFVQMRFSTLLWLELDSIERSRIFLNNKIVGNSSRTGIPLQNCVKLSSSFGIDFVPKESSDFVVLRIKDLKCIV